MWHHNGFENVIDRYNVSFWQSKLRVLRSRGVTPKAREDAVFSAREHSWLAEQACAIRRIYPRRSTPSFPVMAADTAMSTPYQRRSPNRTSLRSSHVFVKKQHIRGTDCGCHNALQIGTRVVNNELGPIMQRFTIVAPALTLSRA
jgi:hypothetical protein